MGFFFQHPCEEDSEFEKEWLHQENRELREEIASLSKKLAQSLEVVKQKEKEHVELGKLSHMTGNGWLYRRNIRKI